MQQRHEQWQPRLSQQSQALYIYAQAEKLLGDFDGIYSSFIEKQTH